ncbi:hypothetical protein [Synechococcus phage BUCT-ZZ01]|nr:hypothetical protein [Synechococcus phage BUCT-ZZ01]
MSVNQQEQKINHLEKKMVSVEHILNSQETILKEIKNVLVSQTETLQHFKTYDMKISMIKDDVSEMREDFEDRKLVTDANNQNFRDFVTQVKNTLKVTLIFGTLLQSIFGWMLLENYTFTEKTKEKIAIIQKDIAVLQQENIYLKEKYQQNGKVKFKAE